MYVIYTGSFTKRQRDCVAPSSFTLSLPSLSSPVGHPSGSAEPERILRRSSANEGSWPGSMSTATTAGSARRQIDWRGLGDCHRHKSGWSSIVELAGCPRRCGSSTRWMAILVARDTRVVSAWRAISVEPQPPSLAAAAAAAAHAGCPLPPPALMDDGPLSLSAQTPGRASIFPTSFVPGPDPPTLRDPDPTHLWTDD
jgi:hypothetical protein